MWLMKVKESQQFQFFASYASDDLRYVLFKKVKVSETYSEVPYSVDPIIVTF